MMEMCKNGASETLKETTTARLTMPIHWLMMVSPQSLEIYGSNSSPVGQSNSLSETWGANKKIVIADKRLSPRPESSR